MAIIFECPDCGYCMVDCRECGGVYGEDAALGVGPADSGEHVCLACKEKYQYFECACCHEILPPGAIIGNGSGLCDFCGGLNIWR